MKLFTPIALLEFVAIDILGEVITTKRGNWYILVISNRHSKLVRTVPSRKLPLRTERKRLCTIGYSYMDRL